MMLAKNVKHLSWPDLQNFVHFSLPSLQRVEHSARVDEGVHKSQSPHVFSQSNEA